jgi:addiction module HigA family antidote
LVEIIGVSHKEFADYIGYKNSNLSALYSGKRRVNYDLALKLGAIFNIDAFLWLNLQNKTELLEIGEESGEKYQKYSLADLLKTV